MKRHGRQEATVLLKAAAGVSRGFDLPTSYRGETRACRGVALLNASRPDTMNCAFAAEFCRVWTPASFRCIQYSLLFTFIFVYLHGAEARRCCFFSFFILWFLSLLCDSFSFYLPPFPLLFCLSLTVSLLFLFRFLSFSLAPLPPSPLISLTLSRSSSLSPPLSSFFSLSLCSFYILCWMLSSLNCLSIFYTLYFLSVLSAETFLAQYSVQHFICNPHAEWGSNLLFRIWRASLLCIFCVCVCARVSECDFSRMGCNQNTITLKSRAQDHQGRDATLRAWDEDVRMELTREVFG